MARSKSTRQAAVKAAAGRNRAKASQGAAAVFSANDIERTIEQISGIVELALTSLNHEPEDTDPVKGGLYAVRALLDGARDRACEVSHG